MSLKVILLDTYKKVNTATNRRETRYVWTVSGDPKSIERYITEQGENFRADTSGKPQFFNKEYPGTRNAELQRVVLADGTIIYKISMLEKTLRIEGLKDTELAKLEAQAEFNGGVVATAPIPQAPRPEPAKAAIEELENEGAGGADGGAGGAGLGDDI